MGKKSNHVEMGKRVEEVLRIILDGAQHHDVVDYANEKGWGITDRQVREYVRRADELLVERREKNRKRLLARHTARREALFARAINAADLRTALAVVDSLAKLQGMFTDPKDLQELARLAASQGERIRELEDRLERSRHSQATPPASPPAGTAGGDDAGEAGGPDRSVPGGSGPADA
jgi:hypothetical protein